MKYVSVVGFIKSSEVIVFYESVYMLFNVFYVSEYVC